MTDCILLKPSAGNRGYTKLWDRFERKHRRAHRLTWETLNGPIPEGMLVLHKCDKPTCVNVDHLYLGDQKQNMKDRDSRGRNASSRKVRCKNGHLFTRANTYINPQGHRHCRACHRGWTADYRAKRRMQR